MAVSLAMLRSFSLLTEKSPAANYVPLREPRRANRHVLRWRWPDTYLISEGLSSQN
jgi:hypothetical protein